MRLQILTREQFIPRPKEEVFQFFGRPENLGAITPPELGFRILTPPPLLMKEGTLLDYTIRVLGIPIRWTTIITDFKPPFFFVDAQLRGPYSYWQHRHSFRTVQGGTIMTDEVHYLLPFGPAGTLAHTLFVRRQLGHIFDYRAGVVSEFFSGEQKSRRGKKQVRR